ncbi:hypothetical protein R2F25_28820 [Streptomyces sp. UP1A-1]|nr:hypothetical protein [Streptomyces sp. UP1A-1]
MTSFAPDSIVLNRKLPLWYQVSQSLRASILGRSPRDPLRLPTEEQLAKPLRGERADHAAGAEGAGGRGADHPSPQARDVHRARRPAGRPGAAAGLGGRDRGPAVRHEGRAAGPRHVPGAARGRGALPGRGPGGDVPPAALRRADGRAHQPRPQLRPSRAGRPHRPRRPGPAGR